MKAILRIEEKKVKNFQKMVKLFQGRLDKTFSPVFKGYIAICKFKNKEFEVHPRYGYKNRIAVYYDWNFKEKVLAPTKLATWIKKIL